MSGRRKNDAWLNDRHDRMMTTWIRKAEGTHPGLDPGMTNCGVYFVAEVDRIERRVKIGMTATGRHDRFRGLQQGCPSLLELVGWIGCTPYGGGGQAALLETRFHRHFAEYRCRPDSEWFYIVGALADFIADPYPIAGLVLPLQTRPVISSHPERSRTA